MLFDPAWFQISSVIQVTKKRKWAGACARGRALSRDGEWSEVSQQVTHLFDLEPMSFALHTWLHWLPEQRPWKWNNIQSIYPKLPQGIHLKNNNNKVFSVWPISTLIPSHVSQFHGEISCYRYAFSLMKELYFTLMEAYFTDPFCIYYHFFSQGKM